MQEHLTEIGESRFSKSLTLADGNCWIIASDNSEGTYVVKRLAEVMQLSSMNRDGRMLMVSIKDKKRPDLEGTHYLQSMRGFYERVMLEYPWTADREILKTIISCTLDPFGNTMTEALQLMQLSSLIALDVINYGGMLLHGALIELDSVGMVLAGPGGVGKTTACSRVPEPWRALSDDATLIIRDSSGYYWAHPWPTWSQLLIEKVGGKWDVGKGVRLKAICFLFQSSELELIPIGEGEMVCLGMQSIEQANKPIAWALNKENLQKLNSLNFKNICQMAKIVHGYRLCMDLESPYWELIEDQILQIT